MTLLPLLAIVVGISDPCSTNGAIDRASYIEAVRRAGDTPVVVCRASGTCVVPKDKQRF